MEAALSREEMLHSNPLMNAPSDGGSLKRRWDDDVLFLNQAKTEKKQKRFINDTIRNDFHIHFMNSVFKSYVYFKIHAGKSQLSNKRDRPRSQNPSTSIHDFPIQFHCVIHYWTKLDKTIHTFFQSTMSISLFDVFKLVTISRNKITSIATDTAHVYISCKDGKLMIYELVDRRHE